MFCGMCHGDWDFPAPPADIQGNTDTNLVTVGAHRAHLAASDWHRKIECSDCHAVPAGISTPGHVDESPAELTFSSVSVSDDADPQFDRTTAVCGGVYCHGATMASGGTNTAPIWTGSDKPQATCGACHALPPADGHPSSAACADCHGNVVSAKMEFINPSLHINGNVDFSGEGMNCTSCHGSPPSSDNQSFPGGGGAHEKHVTELKMACSTCHGHNGTGPNHAEDTSVLQANVNVVFDTTTQYPGGTTINNGGTPSFDHNNGNPTCTVGCHNPVVDDTADLSNSANWTDTTIACSECHELPGLANPWNHNIAGTNVEIRNNCSTCHDITAHGSGALALNDPNPSDDIDPTLSGATISDLCKTCHDSGSGTFFGNETAIDMSNTWTAPRAHESNNVSCASCHGYHGGNPGEPLIASVEESTCAGSGCHDDIVNEMGLSGGFSRHRVVDSEQSTGQLECVTCHAPHVVDNSPWQPITDPDNGNIVASVDVPGDHFNTSDSNTNAFCLDCHDGTWPGAIDIAAEINTEDVFTGSQFLRRSGGVPNDNLHYSHVKDKKFVCTHCHNAHSNTGTAGINRGRLLYNYMTVTNSAYPGKGSCSITGGPTGCHH